MGCFRVLCLCPKGKCIAVFSVFILACVCLPASRSCYKWSSVRDFLYGWNDWMFSDLYLAFVFLFFLLFVLARVYLPASRSCDVNGVLFVIFFRDGMIGCFRIYT